MKVLISLKSGRVNYYKGEGDYHCKDGILREKDLNSGEFRIESTLKRPFLVFEAQNIDIHQTIKRGPQWIMPKDIGYVIVRTGLDKNSTVLEAGSGSGSATAFFSRLVKQVYSYDIVEDHSKISQKNAEYLGLDNVEFKTQDVAEVIDDHKDVDLLFLDMPEPAPVLTKELNCLSSGKFVVCYLPSITQVQQLVVSQIERDDLYVEEISEVSVRNWKVGERVARPDHKKEIDHTAFLVFIRKL